MSNFENNGKLIIQWYKEYGRKMAWRNIFDPYLIWISEVVLQQTRISQGIHQVLIENVVNITITSRGTL